MLVGAKGRAHCGPDCGARPSPDARWADNYTRGGVSMAVFLDLEAVIAKYATEGFTDASPLLEVGLDSLALLRLAVDVADSDAEIDATTLVHVRTIGDLKVWLAGLAGERC